MSEINELIKRKLQEYEPEVAEIAIKALELSSSEYSSEINVAEQLRSVVRDIVRRRKDRS